MSDRNKVVQLRRTLPFCTSLLRVRSPVLENAFGATLPRASSQTSGDQVKIFKAEFNLEGRYVSVDFCITTVEGAESTYDISVNFRNSSMMCSGAYGMNFPLAMPRTQKQLTDQQRIRLR